jgi:hypothetical protein
MAAERTAPTDALDGDDGRAKQRATKRRDGERPPPHARSEEPPAAAPVAAPPPAPAGESGPAKPSGKPLDEKGTKGD